MKQPDLYERMKEVKLLVDEKRVNNVELLQQELDLLHKGLKQEAAKGTSRRRTRGGATMAVEAAAALKGGDSATAAEEVASDSAPASLEGAGVGGEGGENEEGERGKGVEGKGSDQGQGQDSESGQLAQDQVQPAAAVSSKATLQRGGRSKIKAGEAAADVGYV